MNLGHALGSAVRGSVRREIAQPNGAWHALGSITIQRVRTVVEALDPVRYEQWSTMEDERTCPICAPLDGRIWREGEGFHPPLHDHCRCQRVYHHIEFRRRFVESWRDVAVARTSWVWRTSV